MIKSKIVLLSALVSCALISGCKEENKTNVSIEFMHSSVEQERQAVISKLIARFEKEGNTQVNAANSQDKNFSAADWQVMNSKEQADVLMNYRLAL